MAGPWQLTALELRDGAPTAVLTGRLQTDVAAAGADGVPAAVTDAAAPPLADRHDGDDVDDDRSGTRRREAGR